MNRLSHLPVYLWEVEDKGSNDCNSKTSVSEIVYGRSVSIVSEIVYGRSVSTSHAHAHA